MPLISFLLGILYVESLYMLSKYPKALYLSSIPRVLLLGIFFFQILKAFDTKVFLLDLMVFNCGMLLHLIIRGWVFNGMVKNL
ncbi:MAG: hypothetical protein ABWK04_03560 [Hydrogenobacter sp.]|uniref:hypothetical protein n=1 Tax=Hydrogenobacter thermophilus TaxID=940 RepID=UPI0030FB84C2